MPGPARMGFVSLVVTRLLWRRDRAPAFVRALIVAGASGLVAGAGLALLGERGPLVVGLAWLATLVLLAGLLAARLRPMLLVAVLGLALGVASLFVVLGVASGVERTLVASLARLNGHAMVSKYGLDLFEYDEIAARLEGDPRVRAASPFVFGVGAMVPVTPGEEPSQHLSQQGSPEASVGPVVVTIKGVDPRRFGRFSAADQLFAAGGLESLRPAGPRTRPGIVVGTRLARRLGLELGSVVRVVVPASIGSETASERGEGQPPRHGEFEVLGLLDTGYAEFDATFVLVHLTAAQALVFGELRASGVELELAEHQGLEAAMPVATELVDRLDAPRRAAGQPPLYRAGSWAERSEQILAIRRAKLALSIVLGLIIVVASSSLIGALLLMIRRERRHIGVLAAMGARPAQIFAVFEVVGVAVAALGSALGLAFGVLSLLALAWLRFDLDPEIYRVDHLPVAFAFADMAAPTSLALVVCALVSGPLALRASRIRPIESVR